MIDGEDREVVQVVLQVGDIMDLDVGVGIKTNI